MKIPGEKWEESLEKMVSRESVDILLLEERARHQPITRVYISSLEFTSGRVWRNIYTRLGERLLVSSFSRNKSHSYLASNGWEWRKKWKHVGKFKETPIPAGWLTGGEREREGGREEGRPVVEQREKFQFYGRLKNRRWRLAGVKNYRGIRRSSLSNLWSRLLLFHPIFIHTCPLPSAQLPANLSAEQNAVCYIPLLPPSNRRGDRRGGFEKGVCFVRIVSRTSWLTSWLRNSHGTGYS